jgi:hypothetical protein
MTSQSSAMSITQLCNAEEPDDIKKQEALENMEALSGNSSSMKPNVLNIHSLHFQYRQSSSH